MLTILDVRGTTKIITYKIKDETDPTAFILSKVPNDENASTLAPIILEDADLETTESWRVGNIYLSNIKTDEILRPKIKENSVLALLKWLEGEDTEELAELLEIAYDERADFKLRY